MSTAASLELPLIKEQIRTYCSFSAGQKRIEELEPVFDRLLIRHDLACTKEALEAVVHYGTMPFYGIRDIADILKGAQRGRVLNGNELVNVMHFISGVRSVLAYEKTLTDVAHPELKMLTDCLVVHEYTYRVLSRCLNDYGEVMDSASPELRSIRAALRRADNDIAAAAAKFTAAHSDSVVDKIITYRGGRAVILVRSQDKNAFGGLVYGESASGQAAYVEPAALIGVNNRKQELINREREEVERILAACSSEVEKTAAEELANLETCALLDEIFAKAQWGFAHNACTAVLSEQKMIELKKARHPLIDEKKVVANDYTLKEPHTTLLITGPNTGGKTVSLKIIGLFVCMSYCGIPVTCDEAVIPFFDKVYADIGDDQSVAESLSNFSAHIRKQADILTNATGSSLVLLDEIGSGTDPREGESLAIAILNELRERKCMTIATTHYSRLKAYGKRHPDILVASVAFDMEKLEPTYKYMEGITGQSNALAVASRYGLPSSVIKYASFLKNQSKTEEDELIEKLEAQLQETEVRNEKLGREIEENRKLKAELEKEKLRFEEEKDSFRAEAQKEADKYIEKAKREAEAVLKEMRRLQAGGKYHEVLEASKQLKKAEETPQIIEDTEDRDFRVGDAVQLRGSNQVCEILSIGKKDIRIDMNGREMRVKRSQIIPSRHVIVKKKPLQEVRIASASVFDTMPMECNLIGMHVDEAMDKMTSYLDQAKIHGLKSCRIIHGDGSGALRKAAHEVLKKDKSVKEFHLGMLQEGGSGATVVILK
ncbi:MAG: endonuclease MutS2 [Solobacterium sp.]|nr:endonuclease MutS2 [Solobacterium sp.]